MIPESQILKSPVDHYNNFDFDFRQHGKPLAGFE